MRVLQINSSSTFGGGERHFVDLCRGLSEKAHDVMVVLRRNNTWQERLDFLPRRNQIHLPLVNSADMISGLRLARLIRTEKIDIVHAHLARDYTLASIAVWICPRARLILSRHVLFAMKNIHKLLLRNVDHAIAISPPTEIQLRNIFPKEKITVIPYGIMLEQISQLEAEAMNKEFRFENNIPFDAPLIGTVGELSPLKGQKQFILAAKMIQKSFPDAYFLSAGKDNSSGKNHRRELNTLAGNLGLKDSFVWLDFVKEMKPLYAALDVFVSASHSESFGLAIAEAMASETAVVATMTEGARFLIKDGYSGRLVPVEQPQQLSAIVCRLLENPEHRRSLAENAKTFAFKNFGLDRMIVETERIYKKVLA